MTTGRAARRALRAGLPAAAVPLVLAAAGALPAPGALVAAAGVFALVAVPAFLRARALHDLETWSARIAEGSSAPPPAHGASAPFAALARNLGRTARRLEGTRDVRARIEALQEEVFEAVPVALLVTDAGGRVVRANAAAAALFGTDPGGRRVEEVIRAPEVLEALARTRAGEGAAGAEFAPPGGGERTLRLLVRPLDGDGESGGALLLFEDRTEARRRDQVRAAFIANASHEIRTPLTAIAGLIETLAGPARDDPAARERYLDRLGAQSRRLQELVEGLLRLSRVEMEEGTPPEGRVDLAGLARSVVHDSDWQAEAREVSVVVEAPEAPVEVAGDEAQLRQMLVNLLDNAIKYGRHGGTVSVAVRAEDGGGRVAVSDDGPGIPAGEVPRVAERFYRTVAARRARESGHGLGLAIVKHVAIRHRGRLDIDSEPGRGSTFSVTFPAPPGAA